MTFLVADIDLELHNVQNHLVFYLYIIRNAMWIYLWNLKSAVISHA